MSVVACPWHSDLLAVVMPLTHSWSSASAVPLLDVVSSVQQYVTATLLAHSLTLYWAEHHYEGMTCMGMICIYPESVLLVTMQIRCVGRGEAPDAAVVNRFCFSLMDFLAYNNRRKAEAKEKMPPQITNDLWTIVHCTHGFNRTGKLSPDPVLPQLARHDHHDQHMLCGRVQDLDVYLCQGIHTAGHGTHTWSSSTRQCTSDQKAGRACSMRKDGSCTGCVNMLVSYAGIRCWCTSTKASCAMCLLVFS